MSKSKKLSLLDLQARVKDFCKELDKLKKDVDLALTLESAFGFDPDSVEWVNLGLSSGRLWAKENAPGFYTWDEAKEEFGEFLPSASAMGELYEECDWKWDESKNGYKVTGPNGNSIFLPAAGYKDSSGDVCGVGRVGEYWTLCPSKTSQAYARNLYFNSGGIYPLDNGYRAGGFSVRPSRELS